jgi:hypothetical protein
LLVPRAARAGRLHSKDLFAGLRHDVPLLMSVIIAVIPLILAAWDMVSVDTGYRLSVRLTIVTSRLNADQRGNVNRKLHGHWAAIDLQRDSERWRLVPSKHHVARLAHACRPGPLAQSSSIPRSLDDVRVQTRSQGDSLAPGPTLRRAHQDSRRWAHRIFDLPH